MDPISLAFATFFIDGRDLRVTTGYREPLAIGLEEVMKRVGPYSRVLSRGAIGDALDGRSREGRLARAYEQSLFQHLGGEPNTVQRLLISRAIRLMLHLELMDERSLTANSMSERDGRQYLAWSNSLTRTLVRTRHR